MSSSLSECPLCRADLDRLGGPKAGEGGAASCPNCGGDLTVFVDLRSRANSLADLAGDLLSRGDVVRGREAIDNLAKLASPVELDLAPLRARLALAEGELDQARSYAAGCDSDECEMLLTQVDLKRDSRQRARELYNYALVCARRGASRDAAVLLEAAVKFDPDDPTIWALKLKADLKQHRFNECYRDLAALDRLAARPPAFYQLEQLLPPLPAY